MSSKFKFELNRSGVRELLQSQAMENVLESYADRVATQAGEGYVVHHMSTRVITVKAWTDEAARDNLENNTLLKAVH